MVETHLRFGFAKGKGNDLGLREMSIRRDHERNRFWRERKPIYL